MVVVVGTLERLPDTEFISQSMASVERQMRLRKCGKSRTGGGPRSQWAWPLYRGAMRGPRSNWRCQNEMHGEVAREHLSQPDERRSTLRPGSAAACHQRRASGPNASAKLRGRPQRTLTCVERQAGPVSFSALLGRACTHYSARVHSTGRRNGTAETDDPPCYAMSQWAVTRSHDGQRKT